MSESPLSTAFNLQSRVASEDMLDVTGALSRVALFDGLTAEALSLIANVAKVEALSPGATLFRYGEPGDKLYIIIEGKVRIVREVAGLGEEALAVLGPGEVFGEMALMDEAPRSAGALAHEACTLLSISKEDFDDLLFIHKDLAFEVLWRFVQLLASRLREANDKLTFLSMSGRF